MKLIFILSILLISINPIFSQKEDNVWLFGYESYANEEGFGGSRLDFQEDTVNVSYEYRDMDFLFTDASICDSLGNLLLYTNGIYIADSTHQVILNGFGLNPGLLADNSQRGYRLDQGAIFIPKPNSNNLYYLLHESRVYPHDGLPSHGETVYYSLIDVAADNGRGAVIEKNIPLIQDTLDLGKLTATRHANGRDWWMLIPEFNNSNYYKLLISPSGVEVVGNQTVGQAVPFGLGQAVFSPDGSKYARITANYVEEGNFLNIYDFDRCSGELSNHVQINYIDTAYAVGVAISPNSQYLYASSFTKVYQFDLAAPDIAASVDTVAIYDGFTVQNFFSTTFYLSQLAPDGKIYINANNSVPYLHVINEPDKKGLACDLVQHGVELPTFNAFSMPNFPNYRLGALVDSPCDTLRNPTSTIDLESAFHINTYPNPAQSQLTVDLTLPSYERLGDYYLELHNLYGQVVERRQLREFAPIYRFAVGDLPRGVYVVNLYRNQQVVVAKKVVVQGE